MEQKKTNGSRLFISNILDPKDELEERLERCLSMISNLTTGLSDREANDVLTQHVCKGQSQHEEVQMGLFYGILVDPKTAQKSYRDMVLISRDGLTSVLTRANQLVHEKWIKLQDTPRTQLVWLAKELVRNSAPGSDSLLHSLIRQISGGDISPKNIWLAESFLDILGENRTWLDKYPVLLQTAIYTYLRVIVDHTNATFSVLRQREVDFCIQSLREKWNDCMTIGRDLVRLLQDVARIPEFEQLWQDILYNPTVLSPTFTGILQLMQMRTSRKFIVCRLTPDMENKLIFLTTKVKFGNHKRYQDWFQRQYLSTPESQSLRCDLIRYICAVFHPSNELLQSDVIPRWAVIGWLLTTCTSNVAATNAKLSLFYDWFFFDPEKESIMNIEPCVLVMYHSIRPHPAITATLLDFMCRIMTNFHPPLSDKIKQGIFTSLRSILDKRVLQSLSPLFDNPKLDRELRTTIREHFIEFCEVKEDPGLVVKDREGETEDNHMTDANNLSEVAEFSDEEEEPAVEKTKNDVMFRTIPEAPRFIPINITEHVEQLDGEMKELVLEIQTERDNELRCELMDRLVQTMLQEDFDSDLSSVLATCVCQLLIDHFNRTILPAELDEESLEDSIGCPLFVIFRNLCQRQDEDPNRQPIFLLMEEMYSKQPRVGYHFLYFLKVSKQIHDDRMVAYKDFCRFMETRDLETCLMTDLTLCQEDDVRMFTFLIPDIYAQFPNIAIGNTDLLHLIVSCIDGSQLQDLICQILQGHMIMFRKDSFLSVLNASLEWETIEQYFLWQLIAAHNIPVDYMMPILPKLEFTAHAEALTSIMIQLKQVTPTADLLRPILCRECKRNDYFCVSILKYWAQECEDRLADLLYTQLTRNNNTPSRKRQRQSTSKKENPSVEQILAHLEHMRQSCRNISFLTHESIQQGLQHVQVSGTEAQKTRYSDLLALAEDFEDLRGMSTRVLRGLPCRRASAASGSGNTNITLSHPQAKAAAANSNNKHRKGQDSSTEEDSTDEEEVIKRPTKRKKMTAAVEDDSDND